MKTSTESFIEAHIPPAKDLKGQKFGEYTVIKFVGKKQFKGTKTPYWLCRCSCGKLNNIDQYYLKKAQCCPSCAAIRSNTTHGQGNTPTHAIWRHLRSKYPDELIFSDWLGPGKFERFLADVGHRPSRLHRFKRIDDKLPWQPGNVRWVYSCPKIVYHQGIPYTIPDLADVFGLNQTTLRSRLKSLSPEDAVSCSIPENAPRSKPKGERKIIKVNALEKFIIQAVDDDPGIKGTKLVTEATAYACLNCPKLKDQVLDTINNLIAKRKLIEVEYSIPPEDYRVKSIYFPGRSTVAVL